MLKYHSKRKLQQARYTCSATSTPMRCTVQDEVCVFYPLTRSQVCVNAYMFVKSQKLEEMCNNMDAIYLRMHPHLTPTGTHSCMCSNTCVPMACGKQSSN